MAVSRISCPECDAVLKPAKPLPVGKKVKCPRCGSNFTVTGEAPADGAAPRKAEARPKPAPAKKKPAPARPAPKRPADEDEEGGAYAVVRDPDLDPEDEDEEPNKPKINYAPDLSIKDLRGPAMEVIVKPSNYLIFQGILGFIGWLGFLVIVLIPILFPLDYGDNKDKDKNKAAPPPAAAAAQDKDKEAKKSESNHSFFEIFGWQFARVEDEDWWQPALLIAGCVLGGLYAAVLTFGAVKIQNLESRRWGFVSGILALLPLSSLGPGLFGGMLLQVLFRMLLDEESMVMIYFGAWLGLLWLISAGVGVWNLKTLMLEQVIAGFEYVPD
jgi:hypothetical protein